MEDIKSDRDIVLDKGFLSLSDEYNLEYFFPDCVLPDCKDYNPKRPHQHILPKQLEILSCNTKFLYCQGGVGSAKSVAFAAKCVYLSLAIDENRGIVGRKDYPLLFDSSWLDIKRCIKRLVDRGLYIDEEWYRKHMFKKKTQGDYTTIEFPNGSVLNAMETKNILRGLGASYGFFWIDDAMESSEEIFIGDETNAGLVSRLRLPHVAYHRLSNGDVVNCLHGMVSTNPPPVGTWLHKIFGKSSGVHKIGDDDVTWIQIATHENPFVGQHYSSTIISMQKKAGRDVNTVRRVIFGESIPSYGGIKVYPQFDHAKHVGRFKYDPKLPLVASWDFGFHHPAIIFSMLYKCPYNNHHYISISEIAEAFGVNVYELYQNYYLPHVKDHYDGVTIFHAGDRSGDRASSSNKDKRSDMRILRDEYHMAFVCRYTNLSSSLQFMRGLFKPKDPCPCGMEYILVDQLNCPVLIGALEGGYKYSKNKTKVSDKPIEDKYFADIACAHRYGAENFVRFGLPYEYAMEFKRNQPVNQKPWSWMEKTDKEIASILTR